MTRRRGTAAELARSCIVELESRGYRAMLGALPGAGIHGWGAGIALVIALRPGRRLFLECRADRAHGRRRLTDHRLEFRASGFQCLKVRATDELCRALDSFLRAA